MLVTLLLAAVDGAAGVWLLGSALPRESRDRDGVMVVGVVLLCCSVALIAIALLVDGGGVAPSRVDLRV